MTERWKPVPGYQGSYDVSDAGRVRATRTGRELAGYVDRYGYCTVLLSQGGRSLRHKVHRLVCEAFNGPPSEAREVGHLDGNRQNNAATNLAWVTRSEQERHKVLHGTHTGGRNLIPGQPRGAANPNAKLTDAQAAEIRVRGFAGASCRALSREFGVSKDAVNRIIRGLSYGEAETPKPHGLEGTRP